MDRTNVGGDLRFKGDNRYDLNIKQSFDRESFQNELKIIFETAQRLYDSGGHEASRRLISNALRNIMLDDIDIAKEMPITDEIIEDLSNKEFKNGSLKRSELITELLFNNKDELKVKGFYKQCMFDVDVMLTNLYWWDNNILTFRDSVKRLIEENIDCDYENEEMVRLFNIIGDIEEDMKEVEPTHTEHELILDTIYENEIKLYGGLNENRVTVLQYLYSSIVESSLESQYKDFISEYNQMNEKEI